MQVIDEPELIGPEEYQYLVICWGSNYHVIKEALAVVGRGDLAMLHYCQLYPLAADTNAILARASKVMILENNATGQFANLIKLYGDFTIPETNRLLKFNGAPFSVEEVVNFLQVQLALEE